MRGPSQRGIAGKVAVVTGGAMGIGLGAAGRVVEEGASVVILDRNAEAAAAAVKRLRGYGDGGGDVCVDALTVDVADQAAVRGAVDRVIEQHGRVDVLVSCAAVTQTKPWLELETADWRSVWSVNVEGLFFCAQAVAPHMMERRAGRIIHFASIAGRRSGALSMHYASSKAAVMSLTRSIAGAMAPYNVTVNAICPGYVVTPLTEQVERYWEENGLGEPGERRRRAAAEIPLGRTTTPEEVAGLIAYLASDDAAYITGQSIDFSGGWIMP